MEISHTNNPLTPDEMLSIVRSGLPQNGLPKKKITVIGAGMAGIVSSALLRKAGHTVDLLEASTRLGGRVLTERSAFTNGLYLNMGAMRIPNTHLLVGEYIKKYRLPVHPFINSTPNDLMFANGIKTNLKYYEKNPDFLNYPVLPEERGKTSSELFTYAIEPFVDMMANASSKEKEQITKKFDRYSFENFLLHNPFGRSLSPQAIDMIGDLSGISGFPELSFLHLYFDIHNIILNPDIKFYEITGGLDLLPYAFFPEIKDFTRFGEKVTSIVPGDGSVQVFTKSMANVQKAYQSDYLIVAIPFPALRMVNMYPVNYFSYEKRIAINKLHYTTSTKIGLQFKQRFWEKEGIFGGQFATDLPISVGYYPSYDLGSTGPGILLASYTWEDDTLVWDCLSEEQRVEKALENIAKFHGRKVYDLFVTGATKSWANDEFIGGGDFSMFKPNQKTIFKDAIASPEGRIHFAGEHTSNQMAWIEGAIESGVRAAMEIHQQP